jgi:hypothetical protein
MIVEEKKIPKDESLNSTYNGTGKWKNSTEVIRFTLQNSGAPVTDEIPGGGIVKQRIAAQEKKIQNNQLPLINSASNSAAITPSSSEISIASQQSSEENHSVQQKPKKSRISIRGNSNVSLSSNNSNISHSGLFQSSKIPVRKKQEKHILLESRVYEINEKTREALLSVEHPFLESISKDEIYEAISFHKNDRVRVKNLKDEDIAELRDSKGQVMIFSR